MLPLVREGVSTRTTRSARRLRFPGCRVLDRDGLFVRLLAMFFGDRV